MFDLATHMTDLRTHSTEWLLAHVDDLVAQQRALRIEELAARRVLDERGQTDLAEDALQSTHNDSPRTARQNLEMARRLESVPEIAAAAHAGDLSPDQLAPLLHFATAADDAEWARRAPNYSPFELDRLARQRKGVTKAGDAARREARELKWWWEHDTGMLGLRGRLPDVEGALVRSVLERMTDRMRPAKGEKWDTLAHRGADAFVDLCKGYADANPGPLRAHITLQVPPDGPAEVDGLPIADARLAELVEHASTTTVTVERGRLFGARIEPSTFPRRRAASCAAATCTAGWARARRRAASRSTT